MFERKIREQIIISLINPFFGDPPGEMDRLAGARKTAEELWNRAEGHDRTKAWPLESCLSRPGS